jgi:hypothetical protein
MAAIVKPASAYCFAYLRVNMFKAAFEMMYESMGMETTAG